MTAEQMRVAIERECDGLKAFLLAKNAAYGNSAAEPLRIFSRAGPVEQLLVRIDDKLSRIARGQEYGQDDTLKDLAGYIVLLMVTGPEAAASASGEDRGFLLRCCATR